MCWWKGMSGRSCAAEQQMLTGMFACLSHHLLAPLPGPMLPACLAQRNVPIVSSNPAYALLLSVLCPRHQVALFQRVPDPTSGTTTWAYLEYKAPHTHDVRALAMLPARGAGAGEGEGEGEEALLLSGGNDGQLIMYPAERFTKVGPPPAAGGLQV